MSRMKVIDENKECYLKQCPYCKRVLQYSNKDIYPAFVENQNPYSTSNEPNERVIVSSFRYVICPNCFNVVEADSWDNITI